MQRRYTVLRDVGSPRTADPFDRPFGFPGPGTLARPAPEPRIETEDMTPDDVQDVARDPEVKGIARVMPTRLIAPLDVPTEAAAQAAWGIGAVRADEAATTGAGVRAAVLDTGIDASHAAFQGVTLAQEDFTGTGNGDGNGHGTHCAGTIFGREVNGTRIGVAPGVTEALIGKVLAADGSGNSDMIFRAIQWAVNADANVISMSLGFDFPGFVKLLTDDGYPTELATSIALEGYRGNLRMFDALMAMVRARAAFGGEVVLVAAAGNESRREVDPDFEIATSVPAVAEGVVSVAALGQSAQGLRVADFSNTFAQISGPGVDVLSARRGGGLVSFSGTSMACPHVAGVAALWWELVRAQGTPLGATSVLAKLFASARSDVFVPGTDPADRGVGLVTAPSALTV